MDIIFDFPSPTAPTAATAGATNSIGSSIGSPIQLLGVSPAQPNLIFTAISSNSQQQLLLRVFDIRSHHQQQQQQQQHSSKQSDTHVPFKDLIIPSLDFSVTRIALNPSGRLLALAGNTHVLVVVLPVTLSLARTPEILCKTAYKLQILSNTASARSNAIVDLAWHPLSATDTHLVVLTSFGTLKMFDVSRSVHVPEHAINIIHHSGNHHLMDDYDINGKRNSGSNMDEELSAATFRDMQVSGKRGSASSTMSYASSSSSSSRFGPDMEEMEAVAFYFGRYAATGHASLDSTGAEQPQQRDFSSASWNPFTLYALLRNGDLISVTPFVPQMHFKVMLGDVHGLSLRCQWEKRDAAMQGQGRNETMLYWTGAWLQDVLGQIKDRIETQEEEAALVSSRRNTTSSPLMGSSSSGSGGNAAIDRFLSNPMTTEYTCNAPKRTQKLRVQQQGPYLIQPEVHDVDFDGSSSLLVFETPLGNVIVTGVATTDRSQPAKKTRQCIKGCAVIHVFLELDPPTPNWALDTGRRGDDGDTQMDGASSSQQPPLPTLVLLETIDLGVAFEDVSRIHLRLQRDAKYPDVFYAYHSRGVHSITLGCYAALQRGGASLVDMAAVARTPSDVHYLLFLPQDTQENHSAQNVLGICTVSDILLGYSLFVYTSDNQMYREKLAERLLHVEDIMAHVEKGKSTVQAFALPSGPRGGVGSLIGWASVSPRPGSGSETDNQQAPPPPSPYKPGLKPYSPPDVLKSGLRRQPKSLGSTGSVGTSSTTASSNTLATSVYPKGVTQDGLQAFSEKVKQLRDDLQLLYNCEADLQDHVAKQVFENQTHVVVLQDIRRRVQRLVDEAERVPLLANKCRDRHSELMRKCDEKLHLLVKKTQPQMTPAEQRWVEELVRLKRHVEREVKPRLEELQQRKRKDEEEEERQRQAQMESSSSSQQLALLDAISQSTPERMMNKKKKNSLVSLQGGGGGGGGGAPRRSADASEILGTQQLTKLKAALSLEYEILTDVAKKLHRLQRAYEENVA